jgi:predicted phosphodiesterase
MPKIVAISDSHGMHRSLDPLPDGDILIHAGDISNVGGQVDVTDFISWFSHQPHSHKIFISGNHDRSFDPKFNNESFFTTLKPTWLQALLMSLPKNVHYLENSEVEIEGIRFWGSPWTPWFHGTYWGFNKQRGADIKEVWNQIPHGIDVLITHGPAAHMLDYVPRSDEYVGCADLRYKIQEIKPLLHISGHIHEGYGCEYDGETIYLNASSVNFNYIIKNKPWEIEINKNREIKVKDCG